jgi:hypothetical protein
MVAPESQRVWVILPWAVSALLEINSALSGDARSPQPTTTPFTSSPFTVSQVGQVGKL